MPYRTVTLNAEPRQVDVSTGVQTVSTPWGIQTAQAGDVLLPWGNTVVPVPGALLDALEMAPKPAKAAPAPKPETEPKQLKDMSWQELRALAAQHLEGWQKMTKDDMIDALHASADRSARAERAKRL